MTRPAPVNDLTFARRVRKELPPLTDSQAKHCSRTVLAAITSRLSWRGSSDLADLLPDRLAAYVHATAATTAGGTRFAPYSEFLATIACQEGVTAEEAEKRAMAVSRVLSGVVPLERLARITSDLPPWLVSQLRLSTVNRPMRPRGDTNAVDPQRALGRMQSGSHGPDPVLLILLSPTLDDPARRKLSTLLNAADKIAHYVLTRGVVSIAWDPIRIFARLYLMVQSSTVVLRMPPGVSSMGVRVEFDKDRLTLRVFPLANFRGIPIYGRTLQSDVLQAVHYYVAIMSVVLSISALIVSMPIGFVTALGRSLLGAFRTTLRSMPALVAVLVLLFVTRDAWQLFGREPTWRFIALMTFFALASVASVGAALHDSGGPWNTIRTLIDRASDKQLTAWAKRTPAKVLLGGNLAPVAPEAPSVFQRFNWALVCWAAVVTHLLAVAVWVAISFMVVGILAVDRSAATDLIGYSPTILIEANPLGHSLFLSRELVSVSFSLAGVSALYFTTIGLQDRRTRADFMRTSLDPVMRTAVALMYYHSACTAIVHMPSVRNAVEALERISLTNDAG
jgi:uncharacterized protein (DUF2267 family)